MIFVQRQQQEPRLVGVGPIQKPLSIVVGVDAAGGFGKDGKIPWHFSEDLKHFKATTEDGICIMGRKTYEDMLEMVKSRQKKKKKITKLLPKRHCIVLTRQEGYEAEGADVASSLSDALSNLKEDEKRTIFVIGGEKLFIEALPFVHNIHLTLVDDYYDCDRFFPLEYLMTKFKIKDGRKGEDEKLSFVEYQRTTK